MKHKKKRYAGVRVLCKKENLSSREIVDNNICVYSTSTYYDAADRKSLNDTMIKAPFRNDNVANDCKISKLRKKCRKNGINTQTIIEKLDQIPVRNSDNKRRLNKVLRELNIGFDTASKYLLVVCETQVNSINSLITEEQYVNMKEYFIRDKILHRAIRKKHMLHKTCKDDIIIADVLLTEDEKKLLEEYDCVDDFVVIRGNKGKKSKCSKRGKSSRSWLTNYKYPYIRFVSVPFGGSRRR